MPSDDLTEQACDRHGIRWHLLVHEAGHAVAALDHGIDFRAVVIYADGETPKLGGLREAGAMVDTGPDPSIWVDPDRLSAFRFVCAGAAAETALLGHAVEGSWEGDIKAWRVGANATDPMSEEEFADAVGADPEVVFGETDEWARVNSDRIMKLARLMEALQPTAEVSYAEVVKLVG